jgi:hypothetical protein
MGGFVPYVDVVANGQPASADEDDAKDSEVASDAPETGDAQR